MCSTVAGFWTKSKQQPRGSSQFFTQRCGDLLYHESPCAWNQFRFKLEYIYIFSKQSKLGYQIKRQWTQIQCFHKRNITCLTEFQTFPKQVMRPNIPYPSPAGYDSIAECPVMSFVFVCWQIQINIRNTNRLSCAINYQPGHQPRGNCNTNSRISTN